MLHTEDQSPVRGHGESLSARERLLNLSLAAERKRRQTARSITPRGDWKGPIPMSYAQERLWFLDQLGLVGCAYNMPMALRLSGHLAVDALERSLAELVRRHESLRTRFGVQDGMPHQIVDPPGTFQLWREDLSSIGAAERDRQLDACVRREQLHRFALSEGPLLRAVLVKVHDEEHVLLLTVHHIVSDGWSSAVLINELSSLYRAYARGLPSPLAEPAVQYADFAIWQRQWLHGTVLEDQLRYWKQRLAGAPPELQLPMDRPRPAVESFRGAIHSFELSDPLSRALKDLARREGATLFMVALAAFQVLLSRWSGQQDIVVGAPIAGRTNSEVEGLIGFFVNTLVLRTEVPPDATFRQILAQVKEGTLSAYAHQDLPFDVLVRELRPERNLSRQPLFQVALQVQNYPEEKLDLPALTGTWHESEWVNTHFDVMLHLYEGHGTLHGMFEYATDLFDAATIAKMAGQFQVLLEGIIATPNAPVRKLPLLSEAERHQLLVEWNAATTEYPRQHCVHHLFAEQVRRTPDAIALVLEGESLSYSQLDARANQLAHQLISVGVGPDVIVGVHLARSVEMIVGFLAILKAGGAYLPLDPTNPEDRLTVLLDEAKVGIALSTTPLAHHLPDTLKCVICVDRDLDSTLAVTSPAVEVNADHLAYVLYTSGSTGRPKAVGVVHRNIVRLLIGTDYIELLPQDVLLQLAPPAFDASTFEIWGALLVGAKLVLYPDREIDLQRLQQVINEERVSVLWLTAGLFHQVVDERLQALEPLRCLLAGGDVLSVSHVRRVLEELPGCQLINGYGPTEGTTFSVCYPVKDARSLDNSVPIGRPIANTPVYVLDEHLQPVPVGMGGELYIGGEGLARGYLHRPALTAERFVENPFGPPRSRMYRTGDLVRWRADATIEFIGRIDGQVKIRGFRIEPAEIEAVLLECAGVRQAVVMPREDSPGERRLVAYLVAADERDSEPLIAAARERLSKRLPDYMVPAAWMVLPQLPLTPNGKVDRRALPAPSNRPASTRPHRAPATQVEQILANIWAQLLKIDNVSAEDNFFELGGHSLLIVRMMERLRKAGLSVNARSVYESPTLAALAQTLTPEAAGSQFTVPPNRIPAGCEALEPDMLPLVALDRKHLRRLEQSVPGGAANIQDIYPLTPLQEGMLFHYLMGGAGRDPYARTILLSLSSREKLDQFVSALQAVVDRHDILRTAVRWEHLAKPIQVVLREAAVPVEVIALEPSLDAVEQLTGRMKPERQSFDLRHAPMVRLQVAQDERAGQWYALLATHHLAFDNESLHLLLGEVLALMEGRGSELAEPVPYRNHVAQAMEQVRLHDAEAFFRGKLGDVEEPTAPFGLLDVGGDGSRIEFVQDILDAPLASRIHALARQLGVSAASLFHAAWGLVIAGTTGRNDVLFGTVLLGRFQNAAGWQRVLGMFINTLPVRLRLSGVTARQLVEQTQRELVELLSYEQASLAVAQRCSGIGGAAPLFSALLNYRHGSSEEQVEFAGEAGISVLASQGGTNYPLLLSVVDQGDVFALEMEVDRRLDAKRLNAYVRTSVRSLVEALESAPDSPARALRILPDDEQRQVVELFNETREDYPRDALIHEIFEAQVRQQPDAVAAIYDDRSLTFAELNGRANSLARYLREQGVRPDQPVALYLERGLDVVVALIAILKAGGAYVPLDPAYPAEHVAHVLRDAAPKLLLTLGQLRERLPDTGARVITLDHECAEIAQRATDDLPRGQVGLHAGHAAYIIYTSGSTGIPKGVIVEHQNVMSLWPGLEEIYLQTPGCRRVAVNASFNFDASVKQWVQLLSGRTIAVVSQECRWDARLLLQFIERHRIEAIDCTPSQLRSWVSAGLLEKPRSLRAVLVGGEPIDADLWDMLAHCPHIDFYNVYGPTESTVDATWAKVSREAGAPNIGPPMQNRQIYILSDAGEPVPVGVPGEIYIGGAGVARGYLNRPELTAARFLPDPFSGVPGARLYRSGDLGRWRAEGVIEYLGRNDNQVKIRGHRIELGEIEARLRAHEHVKEAAVIVRRDTGSSPQPVAYVTARDGGVLGADTLRAHLKKVLPDYLIPSAFVVLDELPLTPGGKLDRRALPAPDTWATSQYEPPRGGVEEGIAEIWKKLLGVGRVGRDDNFFESGGHSLHGVHLVNALSERFGIELPVSAMFQYPTVAELAKTIEVRAPADGRSAQPSCEQAVEVRRVPLTHAQLAHWQLHGLGSRPSFRNVASAFRLRGPLDIEALRASVASVFDRHDALRARIVFDGIVEQEIPRSGLCPIEVLDLTGLAAPAQDDEVARLIQQSMFGPCDPTAEPLFVLRLLELGDADHVLIVAMDHLISDGVSKSIVLRDLFSAYSAFSSGSALECPPVAMSFADFAMSQHEARASWAREHGAHWQEHLRGCRRVRFPADLAPDCGGAGWGIVRFQIDATLKRELRDWCRLHRTTMVMAVFTAYAALVLRWCNLPDGVIRFQTDGRFNQKVRDTVGYFAFPLHLRARLDDGGRFIDLLAQLTEEYCRAQEHADYSYVEAQLSAEVARNTCFNWLVEQPGSERFEIGGPTAAIACERIPFAGDSVSSLDLDTEPLIGFLESQESVRVFLQFPLSRFSTGHMERFGRNLLDFIRAMLARPDGGPPTVA